MSKSIDDKKLRATIYDKYDGYCAYCGILLLGRFTVDHIIPRRKNGGNEIANYNPSCYSCNSSKGSIDLERWRKEIKSKVMRLNRDSSQYRCVKRYGLLSELDIDVKFFFEVYNG